MGRWKPVDLSCSMSAAVLRRLALGSRGSTLAAARVAIMNQVLAMTLFARTWQIRSVAEAATAAPGLEISPTDSAKRQPQSPAPVAVTWTRPLADRTKDAPGTEMARYAKIPALGPAGLAPYARTRIPRQAARLKSALMLTLRTLGACARTRIRRQAARLKSALMLTLRTLGACARTWIPRQAARLKSPAALS